MIKDIDIRTLLIAVLCLPAFPIAKPKFIQNYIVDYPLINWVVLFLLRRKEEHIFLIVFILYQLLFIIDNIYIIKNIDKKLIKKKDCAI